MARPAISVCIPVYNRADMVAAAIESALAQNLAETEIVVVDNCSTDATWERMDAYRDSRLRCHRNQRNLGVIGNFNRCLELAQGRYLRILCSDDRLLPDGLAAEVQLMDAHPEVAVLSSPARVCDARGRVLYVAGDHLIPGVHPAGCATASNLLWVLAAYGYNPLNFPSGVTFRREAMDQAGKFEPISDGTWDLDYWLRLVRYGCLGIAPAHSCVVLAHGAAGSSDLLRSGAYLAGQFAVAQRWHDCLEEQGLDGIVQAHLEARGYWLALKMARHGEFASAGRYWRMTTHSARGRMRGLGALVKHVGYRGRRRWAGARLSRQECKPW